MDIKSELYEMLKIIRQIQYQIEQLSKKIELLFKER
jgi:hypothetical protein